MMKETILSALDYTPATMDRDDWVKILMALKSELGEGGRDIAENWSKSGDFNQSDFNSTWNSVNGSGGIRIGTLFHFAKAGGWKQPQPSILRGETNRLRRRQHQADSDNAAAEKREKNETAALTAHDRWEAATDPDPQHPYLAKKGIQAVGIKQEGNNLLIPLRDGHGRLMSLQTITPVGDKKFQKGGTTSGMYMRMDGTTATIVVCEGYATGVSIQAATGHGVAVAFSCHNMVKVAKHIRHVMPGADLMIAADSQPAATLEEASEVAIAVNARLAVPTVDSDFNDMAQAGHDLVKVFAQAPSMDSPGLVCIDTDDFLQREFPPRECLLKPGLPKQGITMIHATRGTGKTHVSLGIAYAMASGGEFLGWKADKPCGVLFIDGEMPANLLQERLAMIAASSDQDGLVAPLRILTPDMQEHGMPDLATEKGQQAIDQYVTDGIDCIIVDNLATLVRSGKENESESWQPIQTWALIHRAKGRSVVFIHHSGKAGKQRGTSSREDVLDTVIALKHSSDYNPEDGAVFEVHFEKARGIYGDDVQPFEARLTTNEHGLQAWSIQSVACRTYDKVVEMLQQGVNKKDIADELGITKSAVSYHVRKAREVGDIAGVYV